MKDRRPIEGDFVNRTADSIRVVGLLTPIAARVEGERARGVTGAHRLAACRQLGWSKIPVRAIPETMSAVEIELIEIDENLVRKNLDAAQLDMAIARRAGKTTGPHAASTRDLAAKTGLSQGRIKQARKRVKELGTDVLEKVQGTDLAKPGELDALAKLPKEERKAIVEEAVAEAAKAEGERKKVSAKQEERAQRKTEPAGTARKPAIEAIGNDAVTRAVAAMEARRRPTPEERERRAAAIRKLSENELNVVPVGLSLVGSPIEFDAKKLKAIAREPASKRAESMAFYKAQADKHWLAYDLALLRMSSRSSHAPRPNCRRRCCLGLLTSSLN